MLRNVLSLEPSSWAFSGVAVGGTSMGLSKEALFVEGAGECLLCDMPEEEEAIMYLLQNC